MPDFEKAGNIASKITNPFSLAALALVLIHFSLYGIHDDVRWKPWLLSATLVCAVLMLLILRVKPEASTVATEEEKMFTAIKLLIDCSNVPMYFTDRKLFVVHCNSALCELFDSDRLSITGRHLSEMLKRMAVRVPVVRREDFIARQAGLIDKISSDLRTHSEAKEFIDNTELHGNTFKGFYEVWIHADKFAATPNGNEIGLFVFYLIDRVDVRRPPEM
jgi:PAS domain-containing protein